MNKSTAELWVKIIAILGFIGAAFGVMGGLMMLFGGSFITTLVPTLNQSLEAIGGAAVLTIVFVISGIIAIVFSIFGFFVSLGLWKFKNWARIVTIIFATLGIISGLTSLPSGLISIVIEGGILYLLAFNKDVIKLFK